MYNEIEQINEEISRLENEYYYYINNIEEIKALNEAYLKEFNDAYYPGSVTIKSTPRENVIRKVLDTIQTKKLKLYQQREELIAKTLDNSWLNVADVIKILDNFGIYYRPIKYGCLTLLAPIDLVLLNGVVDGSKIDEMVKQKNDVSARPKNITVIHMYRKDNGKVSLNDKILELTPSLLVNDLKGIPFYRREKNNVVLNEEVVNIFPYDVLAFIEYYITLKEQNPRITIDNAFKEYSQKENRLR